MLLINLKETYKQATNKRSVQRRTLQGSGRFIGLGGPDIRDYVKQVRKAGFKDITIYEKDVKVYTKQRRELPRGVKLIYGDITDNLQDKDAFYDLDFCASIVKIEDKILNKIAKIKNFSLTFALRPISLYDTVQRLWRHCKVPYITYKDTHGMVVFYKHKKQNNVS